MSDRIAELEARVARLSAYGPPEFLVAAVRAIPAEEEVA